MQEIADVLESYSGYSGEEMYECFSLWKDMKDVRVNGKKRGRGGNNDEDDEEEEAEEKKQKKKKKRTHRKQITFKHITRDRVKDLSQSNWKIKTYNANILSFPRQLGFVTFFN